MPTHEENQIAGVVRLILGVMAVGLLVAALGGLFAVVPPGHRGVSVTLGKVDPDVRLEGLAFKMPMIERIINIPVQQLTVNDKTSCFSSDLQTVSVNYSVLYRIPETRVVELFQQFAGDPYVTLIRPRIEESIKQVTALYRAEDLVKSRQKIKETVMERMRQELAGLIDIRDVPITNIDLSAEMEKAIEVKQVTEQQALAKEYELRKAEIEARITLVNAKAEAEAVKIKGDALKLSPLVIDLEIAKRWDGKTPQTVVVREGGANVLLPLR